MKYINLEHLNDAQYGTKQPSDCISFCSSAMFLCALSFDPLLMLTILVTHDACSIGASSALVSDTDNACSQQVASTSPIEEQLPVFAYDVPPLPIYPNAARSNQHGERNSMDASPTSLNSNQLECDVPDDVLETKSPMFTKTYGEETTLDDGTTLMLGC